MSAQKSLLFVYLAANVCISLVTELHLKSTLSEYKVPKEDLSSIAGQALGNQEHPDVPRVVKLLEGLYQHEI